MIADLDSSWLFRIHTFTKYYFLKQRVCCQRGRCGFTTVSRSAESTNSPQCQALCQTYSFQWAKSKPIGYHRNVTLTVTWQTEPWRFFGLWLNINFHSLSKKRETFIRNQKRKRQENNTNRVIQCHYDKKYLKTPKYTVYHWITLYIHT